MIGHPIAEEKSIGGNQKGGRGGVGVRGTVTGSRIGGGSRLTAADAILSMKTCPNEKCPLFGRIVYAVATRCAVCKWDLKATLPASEQAHSKPGEASRAQSAAR